MAMCSWHRECKNSVLNINLVNANRPISIFNQLRLCSCDLYCHCNLFTHGAIIKSSQELVETCLCIPAWIGIWKCWFLRRGENRRTQVKTSRSKGENQQQTQSTYGINTRIQITALVAGKCSHHYATLVQLPQDNYSIIPFLAAPGFLRIYELPAEDEWTTDNLDVIKVLE